MFYTYINSIGQNLAINLFVYNNASSMLGTFSLIVPVLPLRTFAGIPFLNKVHSFDVYITLLVDSHGCGQRNDFRLLKGI